jgi:dihydrofolate reductase
MSHSVPMPSLSFIVARSRPRNFIGCDNRLPWHLKSDLTRFKELTMGHVIIMGRKTFDSIGRVLPGRTNLVLSRNIPDVVENTIWSLNETSLLWSRSTEESLFLADFLSIAREKSDFFVIGGAEIFEMFSDLFNKVYLTEVISDNVVGDTTFDIEFKYPQWKALESRDLPAGPGDQYPSKFSVFAKRDKTTRYRTLPEYFTDAKQRQQWIQQNLKEHLSQPRQSSPRAVIEQQLLFSWEPKRLRFG